MSDNPKRVLFQGFNPYVARYPGSRVVSREAVLLAKRFRLSGFEVALGSSSNDAGYTLRKGFSDLIFDPIVVKVSGAAATVVLGLVSSWVYDLLKRRGGEAGVPDELNVVIEVEESGSRVRYDHKGREISDHRFDQLMEAMTRRQEAYATALKEVSPYPGLPNPVYLEHTTRIVGWANLRVVEGRGLMVDPAKITDPEIRDKMERGELGGFSIAGIVDESICQTCNSAYRDCNHGADAEEECVNEIRKIRLCEISIVRDPVNPSCDFRERLDDGDVQQGDATGDASSNG